LESQEINKLSSLSQKSVIACGGGAVLSESNVKVLKENCINIWLWVNTQNILERTNLDTSRPLLKGSNKEKIIEELLDKRLFKYAQASDLIINTNDKDIDEIVKLIKKEIL